MDYNLYSIIGLVCKCGNKKETDLQNAEKFLNERFQNKDSEIFVAENEESKIIGIVQLYPIFCQHECKNFGF